MFAPANNLNNSVKNNVNNNKVKLNNNVNIQGFNNNNLLNKNPFHDKMLILMYNHNKQN